ncbi:condensation domain-containing protein, partial [Stenotrophomonas sp. P5_B8]
MNVKVDSAWFPLSPAQRSRWFMYQWAPERRAQHNNIFAVRLRGVVCETRMAGALQALAERNPMLRARIVERDGEPMQCTDHVAQVPLRRTSAKQWDDGRLRAAVLAETLTPFGPEQPLVRGHLFDYRDDEAVFVLSMDHLISDGWSYWRLLAELGQLLRGRCMADDGGDGATYRDYVQWQRGWMNSPEAARQRDYWLERLAGDLPELRLGFAEHTHPEQAQQGSIRIDVSAGQLGALRALASRQAANLFTVILSAFQIVLQRYTAQEDLIVGCPMPARGDGRWDAVVGDFVNMVPLRTRVGAEDTLAEVMRKSRNDALAGLARQEYPFQALIEALRLSRAATHPVFQVMFAFQKARYDEGLSRLWSFDDGERTGLQWGDLSLAAYHLEQPLGLE